MDFLLGFIAGVAVSVAGFVIINLQLPAAVDGAEGKVREDLAGPWARFKAWVKGKFKKD